MLKLIPLPPYRAEVYDVFQIRANTPSDHPINKNVVVQADGTIDLGPGYGSVRVAGLTKDEMCAALDKSLKKSLREPAVYVQLAKAAGIQPVTGQYLVGPDGTVNLRQYGRIQVAGKTVTETRIAIQNHLKQFLDAPELSVDVVAYNSKVYFIITQGAGLGDSVRRLPVTGHETVLDAISQINGLSQVSSKNIWIARPTAADPEKAQILHVDWDGITGRGATATNYQIFPRDRIYIGEDPLVTRSNLLAKKTAPVERTMGVVSLTSSVLSGLNGLSAADEEVMKEMVRKGTFTHDEEMKGILLEAIRLHALEREKSRAKEAEKSKPGQ
jgi:polysaccharide export outer membrane protein